MNVQLQMAVTEFLQDCEARGHSPNTLRAYRDALRPFQVWMNEHQAATLAETTPTLLREYALHCAAFLSPGGAHARLRPVKSLLKWAFQEELVERDLTKRLPMPRLKRDPLPVVRYSDFEKLVVAAQQARTPLRDVALLTTLYDCGVRASELLKLTLEDVRPDGFLVIRQGKGGRNRTIPVDRQTIRAIRNYVKHERGEPSSLPYVFLSHQGALTRPGLDKVLERLCQDAGLPRLSAHAFRRGFAVQYLRNGGDVMTLQRIFGHSSVEMSSQYAHLVEDDLKLVHRRASPLRPHLSHSAD